MGPVEHTDAVADGPFSNADLAPTPIAQRSWNLWNLASLWVAMSVCIPTYMLAASMIDSGMNWWQSLVTILLGNLIVLLPLAVNGHAGTRYGIPFPVYARASFGLLGAHVPSLLRSIVACGWFGIQTWIGGLAIYVLLSIMWPAWGELGGGAELMGYGLPYYLSFLIFWLINMYFVWAGTESIKWLETLAAPALLVMGGALFLWAIDRGGGLGAILRESNALIRAEEPLPPRHFVLGLFLPWLTAMVGYWATLSLNIPDFTRYARSQRDQVAGQALGLLTTMPLFAFVGIVVTSATLLIYGEAIWNPIELLARVTAEAGSPLLGLGAMIFLVVATLSTNIAANVVAPANSFANLAPRRISFRLGGLIAGLVGVAIVPWKLLEMYQTWLISYSGLLGAVGGVIVCDYLVVRRARLDTAGLYREGGPYWYTNGVHRPALLALAAGVGVALIGTLDDRLAFLCDGAWFSATGVAFLAYLALTRGSWAGREAASPARPAAGPGAEGPGL
jgi:NCS1 family nucleobase:cation symporter-1